MRSFFAIYFRELSACFLSPIAYVIGTFFFLGTTFTFMFGVESNNGEVQSLVTLLIYAIMLWHPMLVTVVCMRLFAEEKRSGTLEVLMTAPISETQIIMGKYAGALTFIMLLSLPVATCLFILKSLNPSIQFFDYGALYGGLLIIVLASSYFTAIGMFISLLTKNQIIAAIGCFFVLWLLVLFGNILSTLPFYKIAKWGDMFSFVLHIEEFTRGSIDSRVLVQYVVGVWLILFVSIRILETRRWL